jgi:TRAP-type C4-dicarboxylate transport system permease small subunit
MSSTKGRFILLEKLLGSYARIMNALAGLSMLTIVIVMIVQVVARYVLNSSLIWAEELCRYILIWQTFLFIGIAYQRGELVAVEIVPDLLPRGGRILLKALVLIPILVFLWLMMVNGYVYALRFENQTIPALDFIWMSVAGETLSVSIKWIYISVAVGAGILGLHMVAALIAEILEYFGLRKSPKDTIEALDHG